MLTLAGLQAEGWSAIAAWATLAVAVVAACLALRQVREARRLREEQAQPYVVVFLEESGVHRFIDLVVKNLGATAATQISVDIRPPPQRAISEGQAPVSRVVPETIPLLVPGQGWRTLFDTTMARAASDLPHRYEARVAFSDSRGKQRFSFDYILDWDLMIYRASASEYGLHDLAKAAREIRQDIRGWSEGAGGRGLRVYIRDGDRRDRLAVGRATSRWASALRATKHTLQHLVGLPNLTPDGFVADKWWGSEGRLRERRRERVARSRIGRWLQRRLSRR